MRVDVNTTKTRLDDALREMVHRVVLLAVGRFRPAVDTVRVTVADQLEAGGAPDRFRVALHLDGWRQLVVVEHGRTVADALARAADRARSALDRERSRAALRQPRTSPAGPAALMAPGGAGRALAAADRSVSGLAAGE